MTLRFSKNGPELPSAFVDALLGGEVIFLCGAGLSAPQLPDFKKLVECTYESLAVERKEAEQNLFKQGRFEEVLGALSRRLSDPDEMIQTVSNLLTVPKHPSLERHRTILRLSRDLDNRISVVTTNLDTMIERALPEVLPEGSPRDISFAGQSLPAPGSSTFSGIIHIHGRLADSSLGLEPTPLVLTSADYGDAYMRSGWTSRFLFDLARCKTIVLLGYSVQDVPVRYFLNVLEADRVRFPDLKPVYAFDAYDKDPTKVTGSWEMLAVTPLPYRSIKLDTGELDHSSLWQDLAKLANIVDHPTQWREDRAHSILKGRVADADTDDRETIRWLIGGHRKLWGVSINAIVDPTWFEIFQDEHLWTTEDATWVIPAWIAKKSEDLSRFKCACKWQQRFGHPFTQNIEQRLLHVTGLDSTWVCLWRIFCYVESANLEEIRISFYGIQKRLESQVVLDGDLEQAVKLLAPRLVLNPISHDGINKDNSHQTVLRLGHIVRPRMDIPDPYEAERLIESLCALPERAGRILDLATTKLQSVVELEAEVELIQSDFDINDTAVPSIEEHAQNKHHDGVNYLVRILVRSLENVPTLDQVRTKNLIKGWMNLPGRIGLRLCLHAMRNKELFDSDEVMSTLLSISVVDFWMIRREIALLLRDRVGNASPALVVRMQERILNTGNTYYDRYQIDSGQPDWRVHARDTAVWLRLNMLHQANALYGAGKKELVAIKERRDDLNRKVRDHDFFGSYIYKAHRIEGDPSPIKEAAEDDRLRVASELTQRPERELQLGWQEYCRSDPRGAFKLLLNANMTLANGTLWNQFLGDLAFSDETSKVTQDNLAIQVFDHLAGFDPDVLQPMTSGLTDLIFSAPRQHVAGMDGWLNRLWESVSAQQAESLDFSTDIYEKAICTTVGRITQTLLQEINTKKQDDGYPTEAQAKLIRRISACEGTVGQIGRAVLGGDLAFLLSIDQQCVFDTFKPRLNADNSEGKALRAVMLRYGSITPKLTQYFKQAIITGVTESRSSDDTAEIIVSNILRPALVDIRGHDTDDWGLNASDVAHVLRHASPAIRVAATAVLERWHSDDEAGAEDAWRNTFGPFFKNVWPKESEFQDHSQTRHLIALAVGAGDEFPLALAQLRPYILPFDNRYGGIYDIENSDAPEKFPDETLDLLWLVCGRGTRRTFHRIPVIIDRLIEAKPSIEIDRRLQRLELHAERYG